MNLIEETKKLCALCGVSGEEGAVREYLKAKIEDLPDILEMRTDALGNLLVHKKGKSPANQNSSMKFIQKVNYFPGHILPCAGTANINSCFLYYTMENQNKKLHDLMQFFIYLKMERFIIIRPDNLL